MAEPSVGTPNIRRCLPISAGCARFLPATVDSRQIEGRRRPIRRFRGRSSSPARLVCACGMCGRRPGWLAWAGGVRAQATWAGQRTSVGGVPCLLYWEEERMKNEERGENRERKHHVVNHMCFGALQIFPIESTVDSCYNQTTSSFPTVVSSQQIFHSRFPTADFQESTAQPNTP